MDSKRFAKLKEIVTHAASLEGSARSHYLDSACDDDSDLRAQVEELLDQEMDTGEALDAPIQNAMEHLQGGTRVLFKTGDTVGPYRILDLLGEGGMGLVFRAEQTHPLKREVALKVVRKSAFSESILSRFESERRTLALMDHPAIARVLAAGSEQGTPYFAMELVRGEPITDFVERVRAPLEDRLRLFETVCRGVQHAHQKGVMHRDLKPSNVLVTVQDGQACPKIIDFGIAKEIGDVPRDTLTQDGQLVGTLEYMSPEQASGEVDRIDTRSDVYSLGVLLYELVSARLPYGRGRSIPDLLRAIATEEPRTVRPSPSLPTRLGEDLVRILTKALEKNPEERYVSAAELADDIGRFLRSEPIIARPPSTFYQLRKLVARNRVPVGFAGLAAVFLIAFAATMSIQADAQRRERLRAEAEAAKARQVSDFLTQVLDSANLDESARQITMREVLDGASADLDRRLDEQPEVKARLHLVIGKAYRSLSEIDRAQHHLETALHAHEDIFGREHPEVTECQVELAAHLASLELAPERAKADSLARQALEIDRRHFGDRHPFVARDLEVLAGLANTEGNYGAAESLYTEIIEIRRESLGENHLDVASALSSSAQPSFYRGDAAQAEERTRKALEIRQAALGEQHPLVAQSENNLAFLLQQKGVYEEAESFYLRSIKTWKAIYGERHAGTAQRLGNLGGMYHMMNRLDEAEPMLRNALSIRREVYGDDSNHVAADRNNLAALLETRGDFREAAKGYQLALDIWSPSLGETHPHVLTVRSNIATALSNHGRYAEAQAMHHDVLRIRTETLGASHLNTGVSHLTLGTSYLQDGKFEDSSAQLENAVEIARATLGESHLIIAVGLGMQGAAQLGLGDLSAAEETLREAISIYESTVGGIHLFLAQHCGALGRTLHGAQRPVEADELFRRAVTMFDELGLSSHPARAEAILGWSDLLLAQGEPRKALSLARESLEVLQEVYPPGHPRTALAALTLATCLVREGQNEEAEELLPVTEGVLEARGLDPTERVRAVGRAIEIHKALDLPEGEDLQRASAD